jgi:hypothetical protein
MAQVFYFIDVMKLPGLQGGAAVLPLWQTGGGGLTKNVNTFQCGGALSSFSLGRL